MHQPIDSQSRILRATTLTLAGALLLVLALVGWRCTPGQTAGTAGGARTPVVITIAIPVPVYLPAPAAPVPQPRPQLNPRPKPVQLTLVGCSHGTVGVSASNAPMPHWVIASLHLRSPRALKNLRLTSVELLDKNGKVVTRAARPGSIRIGKPQVPYPDRCLPYARQRPYHLSKSGTRPFDGQITSQKRHRLWLHIPMAGDYLKVARTRPTRCRITFKSATGKTYQATVNQIGSWSTG